MRLGMTLCFLMLISCASKETASQISRLETQNDILQKKLKEMETEVQSLTEDVILLKTTRMESKPTRTLATTPVAKTNTKAPQKRATASSPLFDKSDPFFEENIEAEQETLVFTNEDLDKIQWGNEPSKPAASAKQKSQPQKDYEEAYRAFQEGQYEKSRGLMLAFIQKYPKHQHTDNAHFWIGETYYVARDYQTANVYFKNVIRDFPNGNKVPDAMLRSANCAIRMSQPSIARQSLQILIQRYPKTVAATKAKETLQTIK